MTDEIPVEYDMSFSTNARINYLLWKCNQSMEQEEPLEWFKCCKNILKESNVSMTDDELKKHRDVMKNIETGLIKYQQYMVTFQMVGSKKGMPFNPPRECFDLLYDWEMLLRKKLDKMGLLFKKSDSAYEAMV